MAQRILARFGQRVREKRTAAGFTQESFADACDLHRTYVGSIERGERNVSLLNIAVMAKRLKTTVSELLEGVER